MTQNVDGLHKKAGSSDCIELHGTNHVVKCIDVKNCGYTVERRVFQDTLIDCNANLNLALRGGGDNPQQIRPDGDITIDPVRN